MTSHVNKSHFHQTRRPSWKANSTKLHKRVTVSWDKLLVLLHLLLTFPADCSPPLALSHAPFPAQITHVLNGEAEQQLEEDTTCPKLSGHLSTLLVLVSQMSKFNYPTQQDEALSISTNLIKTPSAPGLWQTSAITPLKQITRWKDRSSWATLLLFGFFWGLETTRYIQTDGLWLEVVLRVQHHGQHNSLGHTIWAD